MKKPIITFTIWSLALNAMINNHSNPDAAKEQPNENDASWWLDSQGQLWQGRQGKIWTTVSKAGKRTSFPPGTISSQRKAPGSCYTLSDGRMLWIEE
ncbi:hypothetical protein [Chitinophaga flava]|uniref:Uncharacterized protein n=1 Tax=Chitinophaga flava TaxID=2259036 RepID=A0A365XR48_9BACT|nr:hypothetical protein [Chitinophaga flava]RBL88204.1 hypothetical protein DF182_16520 [Chitinophaga flava]